MKRKPPADLAASVRQRLTNLAASSGQELQLVLTRYGVERLLYRLSRIAAGKRLVLKGAALFYLWDGVSSRPTRDVDFLGAGDPSPESIAQVFRAMCDARVRADGLVFRPASVDASAIRGRQEYGGVRVKIVAMLGKARIPLQVDVGFGDAVTPRVKNAIFPALLDFPPARVRVYPPDTVVAEKFQAMVALGLANTRLKDFYDVLHLAETREFNGRVLTAAIRATFDRRGTAIPANAPAALSEVFGRDADRQAQWGAFLKRGRITSAPEELVAVTERLADFLMPPALAAATGKAFTKRWKPTLGWRAARRAR